MKQYYKLVLFVFVLGLLSAGILVGADALTKNRINQNKLYELQSSILDANGTEYTQSDIFLKFDEYLTKEEGTYEGETYYIYVHKETNYSSFEFKGNGLWGPIKGVITLEEDFKTIVKVKILEQEETPGLGARVGEEAFLNTLVGKVFNPTIKIIKDYEGDGLNEISGIAGATGTSGKFQDILNNTYIKYLAAFTDYNPEEEGLVEVFTKLLLVHREVVTDPLVQVDEIFEIIEKDGLTLYINQKLGLVSFILNEEVIYGVNKDEFIKTPIIITLRADLETVENITVIHDSNTNHLGKTQLLTENVLNNAKLKKFPNLVLKEGGSNSDNEIDGVAGTTATRESFNQVINNGYNTYLPLLKTVLFNEVPDYGDGEYKVKLNDILTEILKQQGEKFNTINMLESFNQTNVLVSDRELNLFYNKEKNLFSFYINTKFLFDEYEDVAIIVTLKADFSEIVKVQTIYDTNKPSLIKEALFDNDELNELIGAMFPSLDIKTYLPNAKYLVNETNVFEGLLNIRHNTLRKLIPSNLNLIKDAYLNKLILEVNNIDVSNKNYLEINNLFKEKFVKYDDNNTTYYVNLDNYSITYYSNKQLVFGNNGTATTGLDTLILVNLKQDNNTIININVIHDRNSGHWGKRDLLLKEVLSALNGKKMTTIIADNLSDLDDITGVTKTKVSLHEKIEEMYNEVLPKLSNTHELITNYRLLVNNGEKVSNLFDVVNLVNTKFTKETKDGKSLYTYISGRTTNHSFIYQDTLKFFKDGTQTSEVTIILTLDKDFTTIVGLSVVHDGNQAQWAKRDLLIQSVLNNAKGAKFPNLVITTNQKLPNEFDGVAGVTFTTNDLEESLNRNYDLYKSIFKGGN